MNNPKSYLVLFTVVVIVIFGTFFYQSGSSSSNYRVPVDVDWEDVEARKGTIDVPDLPSVSKWNSFSVIGDDGEGFETIIPPDWKEAEQQFGDISMHEAETLFDLSKSTRLISTGNCQDSVNVLYVYKKLDDVDKRNWTSHKNINNAVVYQLASEDSGDNFVSYIDMGNAKYSIFSNSGCPFSLSAEAAQIMTENFKLIQ
ncbi:MAG: hypothetical protein UU81_C0006G0008 [Microgenomates group bacterium GW2011_GWC1_41_8]|uniref:Uncharacterized protein n=2 Tax=Candidatus Roizmaniibacteriota TaxID=1752723 RepID=A0A0G0ZEM5_9BACT|nr:MAG: hypothetical protein UU14_C0002G0070 [Candidatus Roizmanbacteria bacterium GW2011_GWB1_40_7]KKS20521.1 MAG: hypothetical protein UU78_C0061G0012 [Candidatus Roizmanbacteria bacterium GW2011_GWC2_41_7]KKS24492.1 MAG: hypothetical protein UU81_C0006G0008 [Microgenomates group bacterium GW2011_GWC1_41_8]OGK49709.1 MAG: hypothetical protein A3A55_02845 [Candidatus Roizmanbacteria bacterium RIFCSPLOWO2_01_FULL_40_14]